MVQIIVCATRQWQKHFVRTFCHLLMALEQISAALPALSLGNIQALHRQAKSAIKSAKKEFEKIPRPDERQTKGKRKVVIAVGVPTGQFASIWCSARSSVFLCGVRVPVLAVRVLMCWDYLVKRIFKANERYLVKKCHQEKGYNR